MEHTIDKLEKFQKKNRKEQYYIKRKNKFKKKIFKKKIQKVKSKTNREKDNRNTNTNNNNKNNNNKSFSLDTPNTFNTHNTINIQPQNPKNIYKRKSQDNKLKEKTNNNKKDAKQKNLKNKQHIQYNLRKFFQNQLLNLKNFNQVVKGKLSTNNPIKAIMIISLTTIIFIITSLIFFKFIYKDAFNLNIQNLKTTKPQQVSISSFIQNELINFNFNTNNLNQKVSKEEWNEELNNSKNILGNTSFDQNTFNLDNFKNISNTQNLLNLNLEILPYIFPKFEQYLFAKVFNFSYFPNFGNSNLEDEKQIQNAKTTLIICNSILDIGKPQNINNLKGVQKVFVSCKYSLYKFAIEYIKGNQYKTLIHLGQNPHKVQSKPSPITSDDKSAMQKLKDTQWAIYIQNQDATYPIIDDVLPANLNKSVCHFPESSYDNTKNVSLAGHNAGFDYNPFTYLHKVPLNTFVYYKYNNQIHKYEIESINTINEDEYEVTQGNKKELTIITCVWSKPTKRLCVKAKYLTTLNIQNNIWNGN